MKNMNEIGNKYEITMYQWYEILVKAQDRLNKSIECNELFRNNEEWIVEDTENLNKVKLEVEEIENKLKNMNVPIDFERVKKLAFNVTN